MAVIFGHKMGLTLAALAVVLAWGAIIWGRSTGPDVQSLRLQIAPPIVTTVPLDPSDATLEHRNNVEKST